MMATTVCEMLKTQIGLPVRAIPLSMCRITRPYLLEKAHIPTSGTAILFAVPYVVSADITDEQRNVSLYAVPEDYHLYIHELGTSLLPFLTNRFPDNHFALFSDHSPIAEVDAAARAGLGVLGMNHLLITPTWGSYVFIAEIVTDMPYEQVTQAAASDIPPTPPRCEECGRCTRACPAQHAPDGICLSALTQKKGALSESEQAALRNHPLIWGCDFCQAVCPRNQFVKDTQVTFFVEKRRLHIDSATLNQMGDDEFSRRAYAWRGRSVITRNLRLKYSYPKGELP